MWLLRGNMTAEDGERERERAMKRKQWEKGFLWFSFVRGKSEHAKRGTRLRLKDRVSDFTAANLGNYVVITGLLSLEK